MGFCRFVLNSVLGTGSGQCASLSLSSDQQNSFVLQSLTHYTTGELTRAGSTDLSFCQTLLHHQTETKQHRHQARHPFVAVSDPGRPCCRVRCGVFSSDRSFRCLPEIRGFQSAVYLIHFPRADSVKSLVQVSTYDASLYAITSHQPLGFSGRRLAHAHIDVREIWRILRIKSQYRWRHHLRLHHIRI